MVKLIVGVKGTGKTKMLIEMANNALDVSKGAVVCVEKGTKLIHAIKYQARLLDTDEYMIVDADALYGFIAGIFASNHDITHIFIDSALKICNNDINAFETFIKSIDIFSAHNSIDIVITSSIPTENLPESLQMYL